jgi:hypothetical protein
VTLATVLAFLTGFFMWGWLLSGAISQTLCGPPYCGYSPNHVNVTSVSIGLLLSTFLFGLECLNLVTRKRQWNSGYESSRQRWIRRIGFGSIWLGACLAVYGFFELNATFFLIGCNAYSCLSMPASYYDTFYLGICLVATGAIVMLISKFVQPRIKLPSQIERPVAQNI